MTVDARRDRAEVPGRRRGGGARLGAARALGRFRAAGPVRQVQVEDRYLDTADGALARAGYAVRLRRGPTMTVVSVKSTTSAATALHRREELEGPAGLSLDPHGWAPSAARSLVLEHAGDAPLVELVTVRQLRRTRAMADEVAEVELSVDEVEVVAGGRVVDRFVELEAELRRGPAEALESLEATLDGRPGPRAGDAIEAGAGARRRIPPASRWRHVSAGAAPTEADRGPRRRTGRRCRAGGRGGAARRRAAEPAAWRSRRSRRSRLRPTPSRTPDRTRPGRRRGLPRSRAPRPRRTSSSSASRRASRRTTCSPRPGARCCGSTSRGCSRRRPGRARAWTSRISTGCGWRRAGCGPPGASSGTPSAPTRTRRIRIRLRVLAGRLGAVRDLDVLIEAAEAHQADARGEGRGRVRAARRELAGGARRRPDRPPPRARRRRLRPPRRGLPRLRRDRGRRRGRAGQPRRRRTACATRPGRGSGSPTSRSAPTRRSCAGPTSRRSTSCGSRRSGCATRWSSSARRSAPRPTPLIARVVALQDHLGLLHDADVTIALTRQFLVSHGTSLTRDQSRAIGSYLALEERELARLRRTMTVPWRGGQRADVPAPPRAGRRRAVADAGRPRDDRAGGTLSDPSRRPSGGGWCGALGAWASSPVPAETATRRRGRHHRTPRRWTGAAAGRARCGARQRRVALRPGLRPRRGLARRAAPVVAGALIGAGSDGASALAGVITRASAARRATTSAWAASSREAAFASRRTAASSSLCSFGPRGSTPGAAVAPGRRLRLRRGPRLLLRIRLRRRFLPAPLPMTPLPCARSADHAGRDRGGRPAPTPDPGVPRTVCHPGRPPTRDACGADASSTRRAGGGDRAGWPVAVNRVLTRRKPSVHRPLPTLRHAHRNARRREARRAVRRRQPRRKHPVTITSPKRIGALALVAAFAVAACGGGRPAPARPPAPGDGALPAAISGSITSPARSTVEPISTGVAELLKEANPDFNYQIEGPGTGDGFARFCAGETDISDASRAIKDEEAADLRRGRHRVRRAEDRLRRPLGPDQRRQRRRSPA